MLNPIKTTDFEAIKLKLASPEDISSWSHGEILRPETVNYRTQKPEKDGLFLKRFLVPLRIGSVIVENIRRFAIKELSAINVELKLLVVLFDVNEWDT